MTTRKHYQDLSGAVLCGAFNPVIAENVREVDCLSCARRLRALGRLSAKAVRKRELDRFLGKVR